MLRCILLLIGVVIVSTINAVHVPSSFNDDPITNDDCMTKIFDQINVPQDEGRQLLAGSQMGITIDRAASESLSPSSILLLLIALYGVSKYVVLSRDPPLSNQIHLSYY